MAADTVTEFIVYLPIFLILLGLIFTILVDPYIGKTNRRIMLLIIALTICAALQNGLEFLMKEQIVDPAARTWNSIFGYSVRPVILLLFLYIVGFSRRTWPLWALVGLNFLIHMTALFSTVCFAFPDNHFIRGPLGYTSHVVSGILLAVLLYQTNREYSRVRRSEMWIPVFNALLVIAAVMLDSGFLRQLDTPVSFLTISMVCCTLFYYIWLHLQFVRKHEQAIQTEHRIETMMAQIQPHFLFNSLTAIRAAYRADAEKGERALTEFSEYLRHNMDALAEDRMIPLEKELQHVSHYLSLQQLRFGEKLQVRWELEAKELRLPSLTLQPLVENAVTYGVRQNATGSGTVTISSKEFGDRYEIRVADDGPGLMTDNALGDGERSHIGLQNVRERLDLVCGGKLLLHSEPGAGVTATIVIPKEQTK